MFAVLDESTPELPNGIAYVLTGVVLVTDEAAAREAARLALPAERVNPFHWHREGPAARDAMLSCLIETGAIRAGADLDTRDALGRTSLLLAVTQDRVDVARLLVAMGADPDALDRQHDTPWLVTGVTGSVPMVEALLPGKPDLRILNRYGGTSLIPASERGHVDYVRRVLRTGIDVDHVNRLGWTALLEAVILGDGGKDHQEIVRLLLAAGADPSIADEDGVTALEHARARGQVALARLLQSR